VLEPIRGLSSFKREGAKISPRLLLRAQSIPTLWMIYLDDWSCRHL
jgi:hypothetical protein